MADTNVQPTSEQSVTSLVTGIINDAQELIGQQLTMFRAEVKEDLRKTRDAALPMILGGVVTLFGFVLVPFMLAHLLYWAVGPTDTSHQLPLWACYGIVGGVFLVLGLALLFWGKKRFDAFNPLPDETANALKENIQWITKTTSTPSANR